MSDIVARLRDIRTTHGDATEAATEIDRLRADLAAVKAERDRLRKGIDKYAGHRMACDVFHHIGQPTRPCSCGWSEFYAALANDDGQRDVRIVEVKQEPRP